MKYILPLLIVCGIATGSCSFKQKQFVTTLIIEDTIVTNGQIDTAVMVLKKRLAIEKLKNVTVTASYADKQIKIQSGNLDKEWIKNYLLKKGALVFYECYSIYDLTNSLKEANTIIAGKIAKNNNDTLSNPLFTAFEDFARPFNEGYDAQVPGYIGLVLKDKIPLVKKYIALTKDVFPADAVMLFHEIPPAKNKQQYYEAYFIRDNDSRFFASNHVQEAVAKSDDKYNTIQMLFDAYGAKVWNRMTAKNVNKTLAIVIDGKILSAPKVMGPIEGGNTQISGVFEKQEVQHIANFLQSGYLPLNCSLKSIQEVKAAE